MTPPRESISDATCRSCGMPLAFDALLAPGPPAAPEDPQSLCSYCAHPKAHRDQVIRLRGRAWMLDMILDVYTSGGRIRRGLARDLLKLTPVLPKPAPRLLRMIDSIPRKTEGAAYDALVLCSGGKDSTYMLLNLARRDLSLCAWMLDQNYQSPQAVQNAATVCDRLGVPLTIERADPAAMDALFRLGMDIDKDDAPDVVRPAMTYGSACWPCFAVLMAKASVFCATHDIPICFIGTQRGQNQLAMLRHPELADCRLPRLGARAEDMAAPLRRLGLEKGVGVADILATGRGRAVAVPFYEFVERPGLEDLFAALGAVGWQRPASTGACSSNCLLNELGRKVMRTHFGFDLYQVSDAMERRLRGTAHPQHVQGPPELDAEVVSQGAGMIGLDDDEMRRYGVSCPSAGRQ